MNHKALSIESLNHNFGDLKVLNEINLTLNPGDYSILLGLNGAGKTTLFSLITRLYSNQTGAIEIFSYNIKKNPTKALANIGVVFQQPTIDLDLTVAQNLYYHASLHGMKKKNALDTATTELKRQNMEDIFPFFKINILKVFLLIFHKNFFSLIAFIMAKNFNFIFFKKIIVLKESIEVDFLY